MGHKSEENWKKPNNIERSNLFTNNRELNFKRTAEVHAFFDYALSKTETLPYNDILGLKQLMSIKEPAMRLYIAFAILTLGLILGCDSKQTGNTSSSSTSGPASGIGEIPPPSTIKMTAPPYRSQLLDKLPESTLAFMQLPSLSQLMGNPNPGMMESAYGNSGAANLRKQYRSDLAKLIDAQVPPPMKLAVDWFVSQSLGPIEIALIQKPDSPMPMAAIALQIEPKTIEELNGVLETLTQSMPSITLPRPLADKQSAHLMMPPAQAFIQYQADLGRIQMVAGLNARESDLPEIFQNQKPSPIQLRHGIQYNGLTFWLNGNKAWPIVRQMAPPDVVSRLTASGIIEVKELLFSVGTWDKKSRFHLNLAIPDATWKTYIPKTQHKVTYKSAGQLDHLALFTLPSSREFRLVEAKFLESASKEDVESYFEIKKAIEENSGNNLNDWFDVFGPELLLSFEDSGSIVAIKIRNSASFKLLLENIKSSEHFKTQAKPFAGKELNFLQVNFPLPDDLSDNETTGGNAAMVKSLFNLMSGFRLYWTLEDDYLLLASVPQVLMDHLRSTVRTPVTTWLDSQQRQSLKESLVFYSGQYENLPRDTYYLQLRVLDSLGLMLNSSSNLLDLPSAMDLNFPTRGSLGFQLDANQQGLSFEASFENSLIDLFHAGGLSQTMMVTGILASVALPAYQDYGVRVEVTNLFLTAKPFQNNLETFYQKNGRFPNEQEVNQLNLTVTHPKVLTLTIMPETGEIILYLQGQPEFEGGTLTLKPVIDGSAINWDCGGNIGDRYLPQACRKND